MGQYVQLLLFYYKGESHEVRFIIYSILGAGLYMFVDWYISVIEFRLLLFDICGDKKMKKVVDHMDSRLVVCCNCCTILVLAAT